MRRRPLSTYIPAEDPYWQVVARVAAPSTVAARGVNRLAWIMLSSGRSIFDATRTDIEAWAAATENARVADSRMRILRRFYAAAMELGAVSVDPTAEIARRPRERSALSRRFSEDEVGSVLTALRARLRTQRPKTTLYRDLVVMAFGLWLSCSADVIRAMRWENVRLDAAAPEALIPSIADSWLSMPKGVAQALRDLRNDLASHGVELIPEDAVIASIHPRIRFEWTSDTRSVLEPLSMAGLYRVINRCYEEGGIVATPKKPLPAVRRRRKTRGPVGVLLQWMGRSSVDEVEKALASAGQKQRVAMRR